MKNDRAELAHQKQAKPELVAEKGNESWVGRIPLIRPGTYADGLPYDEVTYLAFKLILKPNRFVSRDSLFEFAKVLKKPAELNGISFSTKDFIHEKIKIREVLFVDTPDYRFYNNAFILRRRILYDEGFPANDLTFDTQSVF